MMANPIQRKLPLHAFGVRRRGKILVLVGLLLTLLLGMVALAVDLGIIMMTRTQLQASSDSGSLAAGTELLSGLGAGAYRNPDQVKSNGQTQAVNYVGLYPAAEADSTYIEPDRDTRFGKASFDMATGTWTFSWGATPYNAAGVSTLRSSIGTTPGDCALPLVFARVLGNNTADITADSAAVIMPASGIQILPGSGLGSGLSPFAFWKKTWDKYWRARAYWKANNMVASDLTQANGGHLIPDDADLDANGNPQPLFYEILLSGNNNRVTYRQLFDDRYGVIDPNREDPSNITTTPDGTLEINIYPLSNEAGNFGTVNIGHDENSTAILSRQIEYGLNETDLAPYENNEIDPSIGDPMTLTGDTGISGGIEASVEAIIGQKRAILLYSEVENPGNNAAYTIVDMVAIRIMAVKLTGQNKTLIIQPDSMSDAAAVPSYNEEIGEETTLFTPLILAR